MATCTQCFRKVGTDHIEFFEHLCNGGQIHRNDTLNDIEETLDMQTIVQRHGCVCHINRYGFKTLICIDSTKSHRVLLLKRNLGDWDESEDYIPVIHACDDNQWQEVSTAELNELHNLVAFFNKNCCGFSTDKLPYRLFLIEDVPLIEDKGSVFTDILEFTEKYRAAVQKIEETKRKAKEQTKAKALEKKRKQLEKLKKELGEE